jgi:5-methylcytosine-specific restriction protein A
MKGDTLKFDFVLRAMFTEASNDGLCELEVNAGKFHRVMGGYPGPDNRMPIVCGVMRSEFNKERGDVIAYEPPKGKGPRLTIRYILPR